MADKLSRLSLYKQLLRGGQGLSNYNFREYAIRRVRDGFRSTKDVTEPTALNQLVSKATENLALIQRQVSIGQAYETQHKERYAHH